MQKIASPQDLQAELRSLLAYASGAQPSRVKLAQALRDLAGRVMAKEPTDEQIEALQQEAEDAGDRKMADLCKKALKGSASALKEVAKAIANARGMEASAITARNDTFDKIRTILEREGELYLKTREGLARAFKTLSNQEGRYPDKALATATAILEKLRAIEKRAEKFAGRISDFSRALNSQFGPGPELETLTNGSRIYHKALQELKESLSGAHPATTAYILVFTSDFVARLKWSTSPSLHDGIQQMLNGFLMGHARLNLRAAAGINPLELPEMMARNFIVELNQATQNSDIGPWRARDAGWTAEAGWLDLTSENTSTLEVRVETDVRSGYDLRVYGYFNGSREANQALDKALVRSQVVGGSNEILRAMKGLPPVVGKAFEAALQSTQTSDKAYAELQAVANDLKHTAIALLRRDGYDAEIIMSHTTIEGRAALYGALNVKGLPPEDKVQVEMAKRTVKKAINVVAKKYLRTSLSIASNGRSYFSANELNIPLLISYVG